MYRAILLVFISTFFGFSCQQQATSHDTLTVAVAANVQFAMKELEQAFEEEMNIAVEVIIGSSGKLTAQITQGAPYDFFMAADMKYPQHLYENGRATQAPIIYAYGSLVLWTLQEQALEDWPSLLQQTAKIAIANPATAPYGEQAVHVLRHYGLYESLTSKLVLGESIAQTNQYILSGACAFGFTAKSVVLSPELKATGSWLEMPKESYQPIAQGAVITTFGKENHPEAAKAFYDFLFSETATQIFKTYGYAR